MKQLTNDVITPLNWGKKIEAVSKRLGIHQIDLCLRRAMTEEEFSEFWMGLGEG